jgi:hypothetical protein
MIEVYYIINIAKQTFFLKNNSKLDGKKILMYTKINIKPIKQRLFYLIGNTLLSAETNSKY